MVGTLRAKLSLSEEGSLLGSNLTALTDDVDPSGTTTAWNAANHELVMGIDNSESMINAALEKYSHINFQVQDCRSFSCGTQLDAVFSNATLHWINVCSSNNS